MLECENTTPRSKTVRGPDTVLVGFTYERGQLGERITKFSAAIKADPSEVSDIHKQLWSNQLTAMKNYANILSAHG